MAYFQDSEFRCRCGVCPIKPPDPQLVLKLAELRGAYQKPIYISSGWRCGQQNSKVGGVKGSSHLNGTAADLFCTSSRDRYILLTHALGLFKRVGIGTTFLHVDTDPTKDMEVCWLYGPH